MAKSQDATFSEKRRLILFGLRHRVPCIWCLQPLTLAVATLEHMTPKSEHGTDAYDNLDIACKPCNNRRSSSVWIPMRARLERLVMSSRKIANIREALFGEVPFYSRQRPRWTRKQKRRSARRRAG